MNRAHTSFELCDFVEQHSGRLVDILRGLVRIPSENTPPSGTEQACQQYIADLLRELGWSPRLYTLDEVPGLYEHPAFFAGRDYRNRPNLGARLGGSGNGRSLLLSGHIDTVPRGSLPWTKDPFGATVEGNLFFGRGANDMKGGIATNLFVLEALGNLGIRLKGDLLFETVIDEEFGGANGTLAGRLAGFNADAAIISEPSFLRICAGQRGGRTAHVTLRASGGVLTDRRFPGGVVEQLTYLLVKLRDFAAQRRGSVKVHELYRGHADPVPVSVTKIFTSPWGMGEPITVPEECKIEIYWQTMPGETQEEVESEFLAWMESLSLEPGGLFKDPPKFTYPIRWLPGSAIAQSEPLVSELCDCARQVLGDAPPITGIEGPCDMYIFHQIANTPAVLWGGRGGNTHGADEYVEIDSLVKAAKSLLVFVCRWCGVGE
jgi:acetylornithine deacetylase